MNKNMRSEGDAEQRPNRRTFIRTSAAAAAGGAVVPALLAACQSDYRRQTDDNAAAQMYDPTIDCTDFPKHVRVGNRCRMSLCLYDGKTLNELFTGRYVEVLDHCIGRISVAQGLPLPYYRQADYQRLRAACTSLRNRLNATVRDATIENWLRNDATSDNPWPPARAGGTRRDNFRDVKDDLFQPHFHIPDNNSRNGNHRQNRVVRLLDGQIPRSNGNGNLPPFLDALGSMTLRALFCAPKYVLTADQREILMHAKAFGLLRVYNGIDAHGLALRTGEPLAPDATPNQKQYDLLIMGGTNGYECNTNDICVEGPHKYCEEVAGVCNAYSD